MSPHHNDDSHSPKEFLDLVRQARPDARSGVPSTASSTTDPVTHLSPPDVGKPLVLGEDQPGDVLSPRRGGTDAQAPAIAAAASRSRVGAVVLGAHDGGSRSNPANGSRIVTLESFPLVCAAADMARIRSSVREP